MEDGTSAITSSPLRLCCTRAVPLLTWTISNDNTARGVADGYARGRFSSTILWADTLNHIRRL